MKEENVDERACVCRPKDAVRADQHATWRQGDFVVVIYSSPAQVQAQEEQQRPEIVYGQHSQLLGQSTPQKRQEVLSRRRT